MNQPLSEYMDVRLWNAAGEAYDPFATAEPCGLWNYELADPSVVYGEGLWPFWRDKARAIQVGNRLVQRRLHRLMHLVPSTPDASAPMHGATLLLGPDQSALVALEVFVGPQGTGGVVQKLDARIALPELVWSWGKEPSDRIAQPARTKRDKVIEFLRRSIAERDAGAVAPVRRGGVARVSRDDETDSTWV